MIEVNSDYVNSPGFDQVFAEYRNLWLRRLASSIVRRWRFPREWDDTPPMYVVCPRSYRRWDDKMTFREFITEKFRPHKGAALCFESDDLFHLLVQRDMWLLAVSNVQARSITEAVASQS